MIPFVVPNNGELINLAHIVRVKVGEDGETLHVTLADGKIHHYAGDAAKVINYSLGICVAQWRAMLEHAAGNGPLIVPATGGKVM